MQSAPEKKKKSLFARAVQLGVVLIIIIFWYSYLENHWSRLSEVKWHLEPKSFTLALAISVIGYLIVGFLWSPLIRYICDIKINALTAIRISALSWMGRYLPGKVWYLLYKTILTSKDKSKAPSIGLAVIIETLWSQLSALLLASLVLPLFFPNELFPDYVRLTASVGALAMLLFLVPKVFKYLMNQLLKLLRQDQLADEPPLSFLIAMTMGYLATFTLWASSLNVFAASISSVGIAELPVIIGIVCLSWSLGVLIILAPAGIGVRDSLLALMLSQILPNEPEAVITITLGSRLISTLSEAICFLLALCLRRS